MIAALLAMALAGGPPTLCRTVHGDFQVCARKPQRPGVMQMVVVTRASRLYLERYDVGRP